jgi:hypothetical protein
VYSLHPGGVATNLGRSSYFSVILFAVQDRARICKRLGSPGTDSKEPIPTVCVAWRAGTSNRIAVLARQAGNRFPGSTNTGSGSLSTNLHMKFRMDRLWFRISAR